MEKYRDDLQALEGELGLAPSNLVFGEKRRAAIGHRYQEVAANPADWPWNTHWLIVLKPDNRLVGNIMIKGRPNEKGEVTIGYATEQAFQNRGIMTEALQALLAWIFDNPQIHAVIADTLKDNAPSQRVLQKLGFIRYAEDESCHWWRKDRAP